jgi:hypothetical protein
MVKHLGKKRPVGASTTTTTRARDPKPAWSYDFVQDETTHGRRLKCLTVVSTCVVCRN